jgi:hypothetical protein
VRWLSIAVLAGCVPFLVGAIDARRGRFRTQEEVLYVWSGDHVRTLSPGLENVLADIYWLRTVQYFGGQRVFAKEKRFDLLTPLIDITTALDPRFELAYRYGAAFLAEPFPIGAGQPEAAVALLQRGAQANPHSWRIFQDWGFFHFFFLHEAQKASEILIRAAEIPGAPTWLRSSAADFLVKGGERTTARAVWQHLFEQGEEFMRENAVFNLQRLDALDAIDAHVAAVKEFEARFGRRPGSLAELGPAGLLRAPLADISGVPFDYDADSGAVSIGRSSRFWRMAS